MRPARATVHTWVACIAALLASPLAVAGQVSDDGTLLARVDPCLVRYEDALNSLVADERFDQRAPGEKPCARRTIESQVASLRQPGDDAILTRSR